MLEMYAVDVNDAGQVVGSQVTNDGSLAVVWTPAGGLHDLGSLGGTISAATAINDFGQVVGWSYLAGNVVRHAFLWTPATGMQDLGTLGGSLSIANAISNAGRVVGESKLAGGGARAFMWTADQGMQNLGTLDAEFTETVANGVNDAGQVVGESYRPSNPLIRRAFLWTPTHGMRSLGTLGGSFAVARAINDAGYVVGESITASGAHRAFLWTPNAGLHDLGTLGTGVHSAAFAINDAGEVVGESNTVSDHEDHAFLWNAGEGLQDLWAATGMHRAFNINNRRQVVNGENRLALLQIVNPNRPPVASVGGPYAGAKKKPVTFDGTQSTDPDGDLLTYAWDFGDGSPPASGATPTHAYAEWATYTVKLTVSDPAGLFTSQTTTATIAPPGHLKKVP